MKCAGGVGRARESARHHRPPAARAGSVGSAAPASDSAWFVNVHVTCRLPPRQHDHDAAGNPRGRDDAAVARDVDQLPRQAVADNAGLRDRVLAERQVARAARPRPCRARLASDVWARFGNCAGRRAGPPTSHSMLAVPPSVMPRTVIAPFGLNTFVNVHSEPPEARSMVWVMTRRRGFSTPSQLTLRRRQRPALDERQALADHVGAGVRERCRPGGWIARRGGRDPVAGRRRARQPRRERERSGAHRSSSSRPPAGRRRRARRCRCT